MRISDWSSDVCSSDLGSAPALNLTASRRLALAAEKSGVTALLVRADATPCPSAAQSRWEVQSLASAPLEANAPGGPAMEIELLRHRAGLAGRTWRAARDRSEGRRVGTEWLCTVRSRWSPAP